MHLEKWISQKTCCSIANDQMQRAGVGSAGIDGAGKGRCFPLCRFWKSCEHNKKPKVSRRTGQSGSSSYSCVGYIYRHFTQETCISSEQAVWGNRSGTTPLEQAILAQEKHALIWPYVPQCAASAVIAHTGWANLPLQFPERSYSEITGVCTDISKLTINQRVQSSSRVVLRAQNWRNN